MKDCGLITDIRPCKSDRTTKCRTIQMNISIVLLFVLLVEVVNCFV